MAIQIEQKVSVFSYSIILMLVSSSHLQCNGSNINLNLDPRYSTESPDTVELFNPQEWVSIGASNTQITVVSLKLETKIRLRYARTRINVDLWNSHDKPLQASFSVHIPENALFTIFKMKRGNDPKYHTAKIMRKDQAREIFHFAHVKTNGTVPAGFIELTNESNSTVCSLKFTLGPKMRLNALTVYEYQLERMHFGYASKLLVFPILISSVQQFEVSVDVEELETISDLRCSNQTESLYSNCSSTVRHKLNKPNQATLVWMERNVSSKFLEKSPFEFFYTLERENTSNAVVIVQANSNMYFLHLFAPEDLPPIRNHIVFLLDISDSMHGKKLEQLKWGMVEILDDLSEDDFFSIVMFSTEAHVWSKYQGDRKKCPVPFPATIKNRKSAAEFIQEDLTAHGVTNIYEGLSRAFDLIDFFLPNTNDSCADDQNIRTEGYRRKVQTKLPPNVNSMVFFLSDGKATFGPTDSPVLLDLFTRVNNREGWSPVQIHTIAYGADADVPFLKALSQLNGGVTKVIEEESAAGIELQTFYAEISSPVMSQLKSHFSISGTVGANQPLSSPLVVIKGKEVLSAGQIFPSFKESNMSASKLLTNLSWTMEGFTRNGKLIYDVPVYDCRSLEKSLQQCVEKIDLFVIRLQAYQLLKKLLDRDAWVRDGYLCPKSFADEDVYSGGLRDYSDYADFSEEYQDGACVNPYKEKIIDLALKYHFVTLYTSLILYPDNLVDAGLRGNHDGERNGSSDNDRAEGPGFGNGDVDILPKMLMKSSMFRAQTSANPTVHNTQDSGPGRQGTSEGKTDVPLMARRMVTTRQWVNASGEGQISPTGSNGYEVKTGWLSKSFQKFVLLLFQKLFGTHQRIHGGSRSQNTTRHSNHSIFNATQN